ncbi:MAG: DNA/RNA non-specific endonuclease [Patescibacteria group bacterium]|nr:DNA/RNA non-specific endonuclease [Patescibacteria group bacterium]
MKTLLLHVSLFAVGIFGLAAAQDQHQEAPAPVVIETVEPPLASPENEHLAAGKPERWEKFLTHQGFCTLHDNLRKIPLYSIWHMKPEYKSNNPRLPARAFKADPDLPEGGRAELSDYRRSGFDRGHMAPSYDMRRTKAIQAECFYLSNMVPQFPWHNQHPWKDLEERTRQWVQESDDTYIVCGPVFGLDLKTIGKGRVVVPVGLFKVIACKKRDGWHAIGFVCSNNHDSGEPGEWITPIADIELLTGFRFLQAIPAAVRNRLIEAAPKSLEGW